MYILGINAYHGDSAACLIADEDARFCKKIGEHGRSLIEQIWVKRAGNGSIF